MGMQRYLLTLQRAGCPKQELLEGKIQSLNYLQDMAQTAIAGT